MRCTQHTYIFMINPLIHCTCLIITYMYQWLGRKCLASYLAAELGLPQEGRGNH